MAQEHIMCPVFRQLKTKLDKLHEDRPDHPMFGEVTPGLIRMPYKTERSNGVCWVNCLKKITSTTIGQKFKLGRCWLTYTPQFKITKPNPDDPSKTVVCASVLKTRFIAFLCKPTDENWESLQSGNIARPFDHWCGRGEFELDEKRVYCVNGVTHGSFATRGANEDRKHCKKHGARALCDGHGTGKKCVFTHPDGSLKPCLMVEDHVPVCNHTPKCFPFRG